MLQAISIASINEQAAEMLQQAILFLIFSLTWKSRCSGYSGEIIPYMSNVSMFGNDSTVLSNIYFSGFCDFAGKVAKELDPINISIGKTISYDK